jgi:hypothetical protein
MKKCDELSDPNSCLNRAADDEIIFVLRAHDVAFSDTLRSWVNLRIVLKKNSYRDAQVVEALATADQVEREQRAAEVK